MAQRERMAILLSRRRGGEGGGDAEHALLRVKTEVEDAEAIYNDVRADIAAGHQEARTTTRTRRTPRTTGTSTCTLARGTSAATTPALDEKPPTRSADSAAAAAAAAAAAEAMAEGTRRARSR